MVSPLYEMTHIDVFNGDADGICALHQLRLAVPCEARLLSGVKRDIRLLDRLAEDADISKAQITVLDISLDRNREGLLTLLQRGNEVRYFDHHFCGDLPDSPLLSAHIDPSPEICTGLIVDHVLDGRYRAWAVVAAFGDNLHDAAKAAALPLSLSSDDLARLREIGELMNYNGYGKTVADLHFSPQELYEAVKSYENPLDFYHQSQVLIALKKGFDDDMALARSAQPLVESRAGRIFQFPAAAWPHRAVGVFANEKAREMPDKAHALLVDNGDNSFMVSVRAPLARKQGAVGLCRRFFTGGGREAAAGINSLPQDQLDDFMDAFEEAFLV